MVRYIVYIIAILLIVLISFLACGKGDDIVGSDTDTIENLEPSPPYLLADGMSTAIIVATVYDSSGKPAKNLPVYFVTTAGSITEQEYTNQDGLAYAMLTSSASKIDIQAVVTATVLDTNHLQPKTKPASAEFFQQVDLMIQGFVQDSYRQIDLNKCTSSGTNTATITVNFLGITFNGEFDQTAIPADGISKSKLTVTIKETTSKKALNGTNVYLAAAYGIIINKIQTDDQGIAQTNITSATRALKDSVYLEFGAFSPDTLTIDYQLPKIDLSPERSYLIADGASKKTFSVSLKSQKNTPIVSAEIKFSSTNGTITPSKVETNSEGIATATLTSAAEVDTNVKVIANLNSYADTSYVSFIQPNLSLMPNSGELPADGTSQMVFMATLSLPDNSPVIGAEINFLTSTGTISPATGSTDSEGKVQAVLKSGFEPKSDVIISVSFQEIIKTATVSFTAPLLTLSPAESKLLANGASKQTFTATLVSSHNAPIPNAAIQFSTTNGTISQTSAMTNAEGKAITELRSSTLPDSNILVIAKFYSAVDTSRVVFVQSSTESGLQLDGVTQLFRDGISSTAIKVTVLNENGNPVSDATVFFNSIYGAIPATAITNTMGQATVSYTPDVGETNATEQITATVSGASVTHQIQLLGLTMLITASPDSIPADGSSTSQISVQLKMTATQSAVPGITIYFSTDRGYIATNTATNDQGVAIIALRSASEVGTATVTAAYGLFQKSTQVDFYLNSPQSMLLSANPNYIWVKETGNLEQTLITATVLGVHGEPIGHEVAVKFLLQNGPNGGEGFVIAGGTPTKETTPIMTVNGQASVGFRAGTISGTVEIRAELVNQPTTLSRQAVVVIRSGPPFIWIDPGNPNNVIPNMTLYLDYFNQDGLSGLREYKITALLGDKYNNPVEQGTTIYFTTTGGVITTDVQTDSKGFGTVSLFSGNPFPYVCPSNSNINPHLIENPNDPGNYLPIVLPDFEGGVVTNSCGNVNENDGVAVVYARTWGRDQFGNDATVFSTTMAVVGGAINHFGVTVVPAVDSLSLGQVAYIYIRVWDINGNPPAAGSSMKASTSAGKLSVEDFMPDIDRYGYGSTSFMTSLLNNLDPVDDEPQMAEVTIELDAPNAGGKCAGTVYIYLKIP